MDDGDDRNGGFLAPLMGDGRPLLLMIAGSLLFAGGFLMFLAATGDVLPQDLHYLGMSPDQLCAIAGCRVTEFMVHDRASFGGTLFGLGVLYVWLTVFPLARGEQWAWWAWRRRASGRGATNLPNPPPHTNAQEREPMCTDQEHKDHG